jgi:hypothetical protein
LFSDSCLNFVPDGGAPATCLREKPRGH